MKSELWLVSLMVVSFGASAPADDQTKTPAAAGPAPAAQQPVQAAKPANSTPAPQISEVARLARAGVNENVILTYIDKSPGFSLTVNDVVTLHDQGVSLTVITAMLQHPPITQLAPAPTPPASQGVANLTLSKGANQPVFYPTPVTEAVPLTDRLIVAYPSPAIYSYPTVSVWGSGYYPASYGAYSGGGGVARSYGCESPARCRY